MRRIYPLCRGRTFDEIADALRQSTLVLAEVASCTFPGRPEPRSARWESSEGLTALHYEYLPDIELRYLYVSTPDFSLFSDGAEGVGLEPFLSAQLDGPWLASWDALRADLHAGMHAPSNRAAAAFRVAAKYRDDTVDGHAELLAAIDAAAERGPIAAAEQIIDVVQPAARLAIDAAYEAADDIELRVHLKRARDRLDARSL